MILFLMLPHLHFCARKVRGKPLKIETSCWKLRGFSESTLTTEGWCPGRPASAKSRERLHHGHQGVDFKRNGQGKLVVSLSRTTLEVTAGFLHSPDCLEVFDSCSSCCWEFGVCLFITFAPILICSKMFSQVWQAPHLFNQHQPRNTTP